jgi:hypothetical protein
MVSGISVILKVFQVTYKEFSGDLQGVQLFEGIFALTVGIALLSIFLKIRRR